MDLLDARATASLEDHCKARRYAPVVEHATPTNKISYSLQFTIYVKLLINAGDSDKRKH